MEVKHGNIIEIYGLCMELYLLFTDGRQNGGNRNMKRVGCILVY